MPNVPSKAGNAPLSGWALHLPAANAASLYSLRLRTDVEVLVVDKLWLRGRESPPDLIRLLRVLPATARFEWIAPDTLRPLHSRLSSERLPSGPWQPLRGWLNITLPPATVAWAQPSPVRLRLKRDDRARAANAALVNFRRFSSWVESAPLVRLQRLTFAASAGQRCLVLGTPLPPIPHLPCVEEERVITPSGFVLDPPISRRVARQIYGVSADHYVLVEHDTVHILPAEVFVPARRSGVKEIAQATQP